MARHALVTGGAKSGKSRFAEELVLAMKGPSIYIATAQALDAEMTDRIAAHRFQRGEAWETVEEPLDLCAALNRTDGQGPRLVDCLTLWLSNMMLREVNWESAVGELIKGLGAQVSPVVLVTNEVGWGIVPMSPLGRQYRDAAGVMNQRIAACVHTVDLVTCGLPLRIKG